MANRAQRTDMGSPQPRFGRRDHQLPEPFVLLALHVQSARWRKMSCQSISEERGLSSRIHLLENAPKVLARRWLQVMTLLCRRHGQPHSSALARELCMTYGMPAAQMTDRRCAGNVRVNELGRDKWWCLPPPTDRRVGRDKLRGWRVRVREQSKAICWPLRVQHAA
jgi:hypothetical protein